MCGYDISFVEDIVAAGDLTSLEKFIRALLRELGTTILRVRNPHRLSWFRCLRECLSRVEELPGAPHAASSGPGVDPNEVDLCAKRVAASGDVAALEMLLDTMARELLAASVVEADAARQFWMSQAGEILTFSVPESPTQCEKSYEEEPDPPQREHRLARILAAPVVVGFCLAIVLTLMAAPFATR